MATAAEMKPNGRVTSSKTARRRFQVLDAMILTGAAAMGCALEEGISAITDGELSWRTLTSEGAEIVRLLLTEGSVLMGIWFVAEVVVLTSPFVAATTLAFFPMRLLGPRPRWRRMAQQPGMIAACASSVALVLGAITILGGRLVSAIAGSSEPLTVSWALSLMPLFVGLSVLVSWMTLLVGGRWRAEPSWVDRLGRAIGIWWMVAGLLVASQLVIPPGVAAPLPHYSTYVPRREAQAGPIAAGAASDATSPDVPEPDSSPIDAVAPGSSAALRTP